MAIGRYDATQPAELSPPLFSPFLLKDPENNKLSSHWERAGCMSRPCFSHCQNAIYLHQQRRCLSLEQTSVSMLAVSEQWRIKPGFNWQLFFFFLKHSIQLALINSHTAFTKSRLAALPALTGYWGATSLTVALGGSEVLFCFLTLTSLL